MKIVVVSHNKEHAFLCARLRDEEHEVRVLTRNSSHKDWRAPTMRLPTEVVAFAPDVVFFAEPGLGALAKSLHSQGVSVINGGVYHDVLPTEWGAYALTRAGLPTVPGLQINGPVRHYVAVFSKRGMLSPGFLRVPQVGLLPNGPPTDEGQYLCPIADRQDAVLACLDTALTPLRYTGFVFASVQTGKDGRDICTAVSAQPPPGFYAAFVSGLDGTVGDFLRGLAHSRRFREMRFSSPSAALRATLGPYPHTEWPWLTKEEASEVFEKITRGITGVELSRCAAQHRYIALVDTSGDEETGRILTTGPLVAYVGAKGEGLREKIGVTAASIGVALQIRGSVTSTTEVLALEEEDVSDGKEAHTQEEREEGREEGQEGRQEAPGGQEGGQEGQGREESVR